LLFQHKHWLLLVLLKAKRFGQEGAVGGDAPNAWPVLCDVYGTASHGYFHVNTLVVAPCSFAPNNCIAMS
jgi:hypothetical protein